MEVDWQGLVLECLPKIFFYQSGDYKFNSSQCNNLCHAFICKLSKHCPIDWRILGLAREVECQQSMFAKSPLNLNKLVINQAWKEIYRVIREAELYLQKCSAPKWCNNSVLLSSTGEAHSVHIHDLVWSILCLELNILFAKDVSKDSYNAAACRKLGDFHAEMANIIRIHDEYMDKKNLVSTFSQMLQHQHQLKTGLAQRNVDENRLGKERFLSQKIQATIRAETKMTDQIPSWLELDPKHLIPKQRLIGEGSYGVVYQGTWLGLEVAVKEVPSDAFDLFHTEALVLAKLQSPFIVQLIGTCIKDECCFLVMELVSSNLEQKITENYQENREPFPFHVAIDIMLQIARGMEYLHSQRIMHMDLKASNILIQPSAVPEFRDEGYGHVKLCDFGMAGLRLNSFTSSFPKGTCYWRAPEAFEYPQDLGYNMVSPKEYNYKADVYSFAMTCYEILTGKQPFEDIPDRNFYRTILQGKRPSLPSSCPALLSDYIKKCWHLDPCHRPSFPDISKFLRYVKLLFMRVDNRCDSISVSSVCRDFDKCYIDKFDEGLDGRVTNEEAKLIIRALDGDFPKFFQSRPLAQQTAQPLSPRMKFLVSLPDYIQKYSHSEVQNATNTFTSEIEGVSTSMWMGVLFDGKHVAVKESKMENFLNEVTILSQLHHPNIIRLHGVSTGHACYLVYDHQVMGSLDRVLFREGGICPSHILNWNMRQRIALGIARALAYLHEDCRKKFRNLVVNTRNIMLDERFTAKLCGFGTASSVNASSEFPSAYEQLQFKWTMQGEESKNVYSFGVLLLEILMGQRCEDIRQHVYSLAYYLSKSCYGTKSLNIMQFLDHRLKGEVHELEAIKLIHLALWCFVKDPCLRPSMSKAVLIMEGQLDLSMPPPLESVSLAF